MQIFRFLIYLPYFYIYLFNTLQVADTTFLDLLKSIFPSCNGNNLTNGSEPLSIVIVKKRHIADTIKKRSPKGSQIFSTINNSGFLRPCADDQLMVYLAEMQAINPETVINLSTMDELNVVCKHISDNLDRVDEFLQSCRITNDKDLYIKLIRGVDKLYDILCEGEHKTHYACLRTLHEDFDTCFGPPDWVEDNCKAQLCKVYKEIADCYYIKAAKVCGKHAAVAMKDVVKAIVEAVTTIHCANVALNPYVEDTMPENKNWKHIGNIYLICTIIIPLIKKLINYSQC